MPAASYILAHDLGTTGNKATLFNSDTGLAVATVFEPYPTAYLHPGWAEQDPADWRRAVYRGTRLLLEKAGVPLGSIAVISFSGMMMGVLPVDAGGQPLRPAILWADVRATAEAQHLIECCGFGEIYRRTGHRPSSSYTGPKILWVKRHQPDLYARTRQVLQVKDYAAYLLAGAYATDYSDASGTNLFDIEERAWAGDIIEAIGLDSSMLPPALPSTTVIGKVTREAAAQTGLLTGTPVVIGGGDGACATVGAGSVRPGDAYNYIGSSSWIAVTAERPLSDPEMRTFTFAHLDPALYFPTGTMQCAGGSYDWLERLLRPDWPLYRNQPYAGEQSERPQTEPIYAQLDEGAAAIPPGANGLIFLPYLMGERSPYWNPLARGAFIGLSLSHSRAEIARAVLEGVGFNLRMILEAFQDLGAGITAMRMIGGGARSPVWRRVLADIYGLPLLLPQLVSEATSLGAAIAGGVGVGLYPDFGVARRLISAAEAERPDPVAHERYREIYALFRDVYRAVEPLFPRLAALPG